MPLPLPDYILKINIRHIFISLSDYFHICISYLHYFYLYIVGFNNISHTIVQIVAKTYQTYITTIHL
ncbi:hypothetical protein DERP_011343 [Dermatophagoides pteronyssinus]|uniref:Uncharacterized protein n=1 Tax=Dermatophagoides pteronyssinus TaxID=6956 RepID=A0ABQ8J7Z1_DERPT|nr:hypothetical protein DERP_011343 [Dermatophagoides pteronyssinus]